MTGNRDHGKNVRRVLRQLTGPIFAPTFIYAIGTGALAPMIVLAALELGFTESLASAVVGVNGLVGVISAPIVGSILISRSEKKAMIFATTMAVLALTGMFVALLWANTGWAQPIYVLGIVVLAISANVWSLARQSYVSLSVPPLFRARAMATFGGMFRLGNLIGPALGSAVVTLWAIGAVFILHISTALIAIGLVLVFALPQPRMLAVSPSHSTAASASAPAANNDPFERPHWMPPPRETIDLPASVTVGISIVALSLARANRNILIPLWGNALGLEPETISLTWAIAAVVDVVMFYPSGALMDRYGRRAVLVPTLGMMGIAFALLPLTSTPVTFVLGACLVGFGNGFGSGIMMTTGADLAPDHNKAKFLGYWNGVSQLGATVGPFLASWLTAHWSLTVAIWVTAAIGVVSSIWTFIAMPWAYARLGMNTRGTRLIERL
ncbi:MAG: MFS transporter [Actinomycetaceae bacterium]|nr:MFS transporter [Actinomycetaceae bacterium]